MDCLRTVHHVFGNRSHQHANFLRRGDPTLRPSQIVESKDSGTHLGTMTARTADLRIASCGCTLTQPTCQANLRQIDAISGRILIKLHCNKNATIGGLRDASARSVVPPNICLMRTAFVETVSDLFIPRREDHATSGYPENKGYRFGGRRGQSGFTRAAASGVRNFRCKRYRPGRTPAHAASA